MTVSQGWLETLSTSDKFRRLLCREDLIEDFLQTIEGAMKAQDVSRTALARRMDCSLPNITQLFDRTRNLTAQTMVDLAYHLGLRLHLRVEKGLRR